MQILRADALSYRYPRSETQALVGVDFEVAEGEVFGFLGPNGSGKSTTQKLLTRLLPGYDGCVTCFGSDLAALGDDYANQIGVCFEFPNLYEKLTAKENLDFHARLFDVETARAEDILDRLDLPADDKRPVSHYSKGMKMRVVLARSLINHPRLWFLDEPTTGQDPEHAVAIRELVRERADAGSTVFLTTHDMTVADTLCDRVAFLVEGRIVAIDTPRNLKLAHANRRVRVEERQGETLVSREFSLDAPAEKQAFLSLVRDAPIETIHTLEPSLEDVFLEVTGRGLRV